ncbi:MAG: MFS transporter [Thermoflexales bacterium]|nr:MFS transporter [Thermoflexales bacterium]
MTAESMFANLYARSGLRAALRWLLRMDQVVPLRSEAEIAAEVEHHYRWNFAVNVLDGATFWVGSSFISAGTILPLFVSKLSSSPVPIGILAILVQGAWFLPQLFTANWIERLPHRKPVVVNLGLFLERLPLWVMIGSALLAGRSPALALLVFLACYAWFGLGSGLVATAWQDLVARCFPANRRGRYFGTTTFVGAGTGLLGAGASAWILNAYAFPTNFVIIFAIAAAWITLSWFFLALTREPLQAVTAPRQSQRQFWAKLPAILRDDHNFRRFVVARALLTLAGMGSGFVTVAAVWRWHVPDATVGVYTVVSLAGQTAANLFFGLLADRFGHKLSLEAGAVVACLAFGLAWLAPGAEWYYAVFALLGASAGAFIVSGTMIVLEFCEPQRRPTYAGLVNTILGVAGMLAPVLATWLASLNFGWLFAASAALSLVGAVLMRWWVREPRWES